MGWPAGGQASRRWAEASAGPRPSLPASHLLWASVSSSGIQGGLKETIQNKLLTRGSTQSAHSKENPGIAESEPQRGPEASKGRAADQYRLRVASPHRTWGHVCVQAATVICYLAALSPSRWLSFLIFLRASGYPVASSLLSFLITLLGVSNVPI